MQGSKTKKMVIAERKLRRPLERALPEMVNEVGLTGAAKRIGVSKATLSYWLLKLGIEIRRVALARVVPAVGLVVAIEAVPVDDGGVFAARHQDERQEQGDH